MMSTAAICPVCATGVLTPQVVRKTAVIGLDGVFHEVTADVPASVCNECGERLFMSAADEVLRDTLRLQLGLLLPQQLRALRARFNLTQRDIAEATGIAEASLSRWEKSKSVQSRRSDKLLRYFFEEQERVRAAAVAEVQVPWMHPFWGMSVPPDGGDEQRCAIPACEVSIGDCAYGLAA